jgi:hypothetical protein
MESRKTRYVEKTVRQKSDGRGSGGAPQLGVFACDTTYSRRVRLLRKTYSSFLFLKRKPNNKKTHKKYKQKRNKKNIRHHSARNTISSLSLSLPPLSFSPSLCIAPTWRYGSYPPILATFRSGPCPSIHQRDARDCNHDLSLSLSLFLPPSLSGPWQRRLPQHTHAHLAK